eukprot:TRINITY_DN63488_c0_g1_i1.p1 TRINITY_DN63488_c0_g1~~TRINITY_DN63488_c0_g1_i1.p1  ORF type:complete len:364 (+),score=61.73 TRINITY_DN63488_c0_g1_i1:87-1178(+)
MKVAMMVRRLLGAALLLCRHASAHRLSAEDEVAYFDPVLKIERPREKMRLHSLREGDSVDLQLKGEKSSQRFFRADITQELTCVDCLAQLTGRDYLITEGSLLGASRGGFFMPWDSDGDFSFSVMDKDGKQDQAGFYKLFTRSAMTTNRAKCPMCGNITMGHFTPGLEQDGVQLHCWQTWDDITSGHLLEAKGDKHRKLNEGDHKKLLKRIGEIHDSRVFFSELPEYRDGGGGYLDVEPFYSDTGEDWKNLAVRVAKSDALPTQRCRVARFAPDAKAAAAAVLLQNTSASHDGNVQFVELNCPAKPSALLEKYYGKKWTEEMYNNFNGKRWVSTAHAEPLLNYLVRQHKYTGPAFTPVSDKDT